VFGFSPDGYHLLNTFLFFLDAILIYLILKKLKLHRIIYLSIPLIFILLPNYSTIHFWPSVFPNHFCLVLFLCSFLFDLKALESDFPKLLIWKLISVIAIVVNVLTYELFLPFFYLSLILTTYYFKQLKINNLDLTGNDKKINVKKLIYLLLTNFLSLKIALVYKLFFTVTSVRMLGSETSLSDHFKWLIVNVFRLDYSEYDYGFNIKQSLLTNFYEYGLMLPDKLLQVYHYYPDKGIFFLSLVITFIVFGYVYRVVKKYDFKIFNLKTVSKITIAGVIIFFWGYSIFLTNYSIAFTPTGIGNRVSIGAAIGVAITWVGLIIGICILIKNDKFRNIFFSFSVTTLCVSGFIIINTISSFWIKASDSENEVLKEIKNSIPVLPDSTILMLDGVCSYIGPAIVFESSWDLAGALRIAYSNKNLKADIITPTLGITVDGFITSMYGEDYFYPYTILIYNYYQKRVYRINNIKEALDYFESVDSNYNGICPEGYEAHGIKIFW